MKEIKLSIIVPIYNVEAYLEKCVRSLCSPKLDFAEILLIDDGSTDNCPNIADMLAQKYKNVFVFHKTNGGLGDARNFGVKQAKGKFVMFIDSDDYVDEGISEVEQYLEDGLDAILMGYKAEYLKEIKLIKN
ncbi:MAG: glycosyltransferase family 2 protein, partial [Clostridia bacterium]|nr:glycosyltransferase family 2 protein [Clostridia bacterium]